MPSAAAIGVRGRRHGVIDDDALSTPVVAVFLLAQFIFKVSSPVI